MQQDYDYDNDCMMEKPLLSPGDESKSMAMEQLEGKVQEATIKVVFFTAAFYVHDGVSMTIRRIISYLKTQGAQALVVTTCPPNSLREMEGYDTVVVEGTPVPLQQNGMDYMLGVDVDKESEAKILDFNPTVAHFTVPDLVGIDGIRLCQEHGIPYFATWHSNYVDYMKYYNCIHWWLGPFMTRYFWGFYSYIPAVYVPTSFIKEKCTREGYARQTNLRIWGRGVDMQFFTPDRNALAFRKKHHIPENSTVILWVGRLVQEKRIDIFANCIKRLEAEQIPYYALVVGKGGQANIISHLPNTLCIGWIEGEELATAYAASDLLLFPSPVETFGNVTLEALSCGIPCVVDEGCSGHLIESGLNGFTCKSDDQESYYEATKKIVSDPALLLELKQNSRDSVRKFECTKILQDMVDIYKEIALTFDDLPKRQMKQSCCSFKTLGSLGKNALATINVCFSSVRSCIQCCSSLRGHPSSDRKDG